MAAHNHGVSVSWNGNHFHGTFGEDSDNTPVGMYDGNRNYYGSHGGIDGGNPLYKTTTNGNHTHNVTIANTGSGSAHENRQPFTVVNRWRRTA